MNCLNVVVHFTDWQVGGVCFSKAGDIEQMTEQLFQVEFGVSLLFRVLH